MLAMSKDRGNDGMSGRISGPKAKAMRKQSYAGLREGLSPYANPRGSKGAE